MANHAVMIPSVTMAEKIDSLVRSIKGSQDLDNGNIVFLNDGISATSGEGEVWVASTPATTTVTGAWMVGEPEVVITDSKYKGLDPDPRNYYLASGTIGTAFKVKQYDIVRLTADAFSNARSTNTYAGIGVDGAKLTWQASSANALFKFVEATKLPLSSGSPGNNTVTIFRLEAVSE